jgi:Mg-chelatase subunit ChlD
LVTITGELGKVTREKISVQVDGKKADVTDLTYAGDAPINFVVLLDSSGSMRDKAEFETRNGLELFDQLITMGNHGYLGDFDDELYLDRKSSTAEAAKHEIRQIKFGGGSAIYDSVLAGAKFLSKESGQSEAPHLVLVLSDGEDRTSRNGPDDVIQQLQTLGTVVHSITLLGNSPDKKAVESYIRLSSETGGTSTVLTQPKEFLPPLLHAVHQQYWLTIECSSPEKQKLHSILFSSADGSGFKVHGPGKIVLQ